MVANDKFILKENTIIELDYCIVQNIDRYSIL